MKDLLGLLWKDILYQPLLFLLIILYRVFNNFGLAIIALTILINTVLLPIRIPAQKSAKKLQDLKPKLDQLKKKHGKDAKKLQEEQMKLYKEQGINPAGGCLPLIVQFLILIALYQVFIGTLNNGKIDGTAINSYFLWLNLSKPDPYYILPILAGLSQFILSKMMSPVQQNNKAKNGKNESLTDEMGQAMQTQMLYFMPLLTVIFALKFPSGLALYWISTTIFSIVQQYYITGLGGLSQWIKRT